MIMTILQYTRTKEPIKISNKLMIDTDYFLPGDGLAACHVSNANSVVIFYICLCFLPFRCDFTFLFLVYCLCGQCHPT